MVEGFLAREIRLESQGQLPILPIPRATSILKEFRADRNFFDEDISADETVLFQRDKFKNRSAFCHCGSIIC